MMLLVNFSSLLINESMNTTGLRFSLHHNFVILTTRFNVEFVRVRVGITLFEVMLQSITQHQSPLVNIQLNGVAGILSGNVVSEGGSHWFESYERIIEASGGISAPPVPVIQSPISRRSFFAVDLPVVI